MALGMIALDLGIGYAVTDQLYLIAAIDGSGDRLDDEGAFIFTENLD